MRVVLNQPLQLGVQVGGIVDLATPTGKILKSYRLHSIDGNVVTLVPC